MGGGGHFSGGGGSVAHGSAGYGYHGSAGYSRAPAYGGAYHGGSYPGSGYRGYGYGWHSNGGYRPYPYRPWGYGRSWGYPWWGFGYAGLSWYPWWGWGGWDNSYYNYYPSDAYSVQAYPYAYPPSGDYSQDNQTGNQTQDQIDRLTAEVDQLRSQQSQSSGQLQTARTVLVYLDGHTEDVQNYAIVGKTLWIFDESRARKVSLSELDLPATKHDNEDRGIDFVLPSSSR
jgi:hypothetical protein